MNQEIFLRITGKLLNEKFSSQEEKNLHILVLVYLTQNNLKNRFVSRNGKSGKY